MVKIRLRRPGKSIKGRTHQKIVVTEKSWARESKFIDQIGYYDPGRDLLKIDTDKYKEWIAKGAQPSETVASLFKNYGKPKKVKKGKSFRPGERQDYPKAAEASAKEQRPQGVPTEASGKAENQGQKPEETAAESKKEEAETTEAPKSAEAERQGSKEVEKAEEKPDQKKEAETKEKEEEASQKKEEEPKEQKDKEEPKEEKKATEGSPDRSVGEEESK
ncbi:MAG: 30S ribosomal protein S16 [Candidatus Omnitrophica bacterium]|nr:30S ribosomal protein S16 [Candidatus Omnitrophota bacterium]